MEIIYPSRCLGCGKKEEIFCQDCISKTPRNKKITENNIYALFSYQDPLIKKLIWNLKYYHHPNLGQRLGEVLYEEFIEEIAEIKSYLIDQPIIVIPAPLSKNRTRTRGYNQAQKIALGFCNKGKPVNFIFRDNIVFKKIETLPQAKINNREKRLKNICGVFGLKNEKLIKGKTIIIIDDVTTTGGTIIEIIKILKESGAEKVFGFTIAH
ncbi:MAG: phosphoribosyltransferase family protein [Candidatus Pacebacteria bacterium]|nr:phosphoribosyltransferase family protein [Candidatus Paceibacterota bacterium]